MGGSGGGVEGPPPLAHVVGFLTLGLKLDRLLDPPPFFFFACKPKMDPLFKNPGSAPDKVHTRYRLYLRPNGLNQTRMYVLKERQRLWENDQHSCQIIDDREWLPCMCGFHACVGAMLE